MCGIAALFAPAGARDGISRAALSAMQASLRVRGPDGEGTWFDPAGRVGLAHTRLAIIDPPGGAQPMASDDGDVVLVFNGEIYNHVELRRSLERHGERFTTSSDTEVLLRLYLREGEAALDRLRGMYALVVWDGRDRTLRAARDPFGIRPLYICDTAGGVALASQVRALRAAGVSSTEVDPVAEAGFLMFGHVPEPLAWYQGVRAVPAGAWLTVDERGVRRQHRMIDIGSRIEEAAQAAEPESEDVACTRIARALAGSVEAHLVADVPVGLFLSAGIDSAAMARFAASARRSPVAALTTAFDAFEGTDDDEAPGARRLAESLGIESHVRRYSLGELAAQLEPMLTDMDLPSIDGFNTWLTAASAAEHGLKAVLSGAGADELLGGYPAFVDLPRWTRMLAPLTQVPGYTRAAGVLLPPLARALGLHPKAAAVPALSGTWEGAYLARRGIFMPWELAGLMGVERARAGLADLDALERPSPPPRAGPFATVATLECTRYLRSQLLRDADWAGMAHGVEIRVPYIDLMVADAAVRSVARLRPPAGKRLLARVASGGEELAVRPKTGFTIPMHALLEHERAGLDAWRGVPRLARAKCPWPRRMCYALARRWSA